MSSSRNYFRALRLVVLLTGLALTLASPSSAQSMSVPTGAQAELIAKLAGDAR
jgi:hypothetical protein